MIGLVLVTHGRLAEEFKAALEHVVGPQEQVEAISLGPDDDMGQRRQIGERPPLGVQNGGEITISDATLDRYTSPVSIKGKHAIKSFKRKLDVLAVSNIVEAVARAENADLARRDHDGLGIRD